MEQLAYQLCDNRIFIFARAKFWVSNVAGHKMGFVVVRHFCFSMEYQYFDSVLPFHYYASI